MPRVEVDRQLGGVPTPAIDMQKAEKKSLRGLYISSADVNSVARHSLLENATIRSGGAGLEPNASHCICNLSGHGRWACLGVMEY